MINFTVPGTPQGKGRARSFVRNGHVGHYTPEKTRTYEGMIRVLAMQAMGANPPIEGPVEMTLFIVMPVPKSWPAWKRDMAVAGQIMPTTKPDVSNIQKAVEDALNGVVWLDDCQVVSVIKTKLYTGGEFRNPGVYVSVTQMRAAPAQCDRKSAERVLHGS